MPFWVQIHPERDPIKIEEGWPDPVPIRCYLPCDDFEKGIVSNAYDLYYVGDMYQGNRDQKILVDINKSRAENNLSGFDPLLQAFYKPCKITTEKKYFCEVEGQVTKGVVESNTYEYTSDKMINTVVKTELTYKNGILQEQKITTNVSDLDLREGHEGEYRGHQDEEIVYTR